MQTDSLHPDKEAAQPQAVEALKIQTEHDVTTRRLGYEQERFMVKSALWTLVGMASTGLVCFYLKADDVFKVIVPFATFVLGLLFPRRSTDSKA